LFHEKFFTYDKDNLLNKITIHNLNFWPKYDEISFNEKTDSVGNYYTQSLKYYYEKKELIKEEKFAQPEYNRGSILSELKFYKYDEKGNCIEEKTKYGYSGVAYVKSLTQKIELLMQLIRHPMIRTLGMNQCNIFTTEEMN
jgi:hypothetical protein